MNQMTPGEIIAQTEIFTEALLTVWRSRALTVGQLKRQLEDGLAYIEARGADNVAEELLVAVAALRRVNEGIASSSLMATGPQTASLYSAITRRSAAADLCLRENHSEAASHDPINSTMA